MTEPEEVTVTGNKLGTAICEALDIDTTNVRRIVIDCGCDDIAMVTITQAVTMKSGDTTIIGEVFQHYKLEPKP